jgi:hypothetical protein
LARLERDGLLIRQGRQLIVRADKLENSMSLRIADSPINIPKSNVFRARTPKHEPSSGTRASCGEADALSQV